MRALHRAALIRAYRTLATGLGGSAVATALAGVIAAAVGGQPVSTAAIAAAGALASTVVSAAGSFWRGVAGGLPEVPDDTAPAGV